MIHVYQTNQGKNRRICEAFAAGCGAPIVPPYPLLPGDMFSFGCLRGLLPTLRHAQREGRTWYYGDNGYFKPAKRGRNGTSGYLRVTRNAMQHDGTGHADSGRWQALDMSIAPWRRNGRHIVLCPPARLIAAILEFDADQWLRDTQARLKTATDRPIRLRKKMSWREVQSGEGPPLSYDLHNAWALVTHSSNAAVEALLTGVPVFCTAPCASYRMGRPDIERIEAPLMPDDRQQWAQNLAAAQWSLTEMVDGTCWRELQACTP
jgi:hypothetical protein